MVDLDVVVDEIHHDVDQLLKVVAGVDEIHHAVDQDDAQLLKVVHHDVDHKDQLLKVVHHDVDIDQTNNFQYAPLCVDRVDQCVDYHCVAHYIVVVE